MIISSDRFLMVIAPGNCYSCNGANSFIQLILSPGFRIVSGKDEYPNEGNPEDEFMTLSWVTAINETALTRINDIAPLWKVAESKTLQQRVFMNHCIACGTHQGDFYLTKPDMPFWPMTEDGAKAMRVVEIDCAIEVASLSPSSGLRFAIKQDGTCGLPDWPKHERKQPKKRIPKS